MMANIPYGRQDITAEDLAEVARVLQSDFLTQGPEIPLFEKAFADYLGAPYAMAVSNGTAALHLAVMALGVKPTQKVLTSPITFCASANSVRYVGAQVDFIDIDPNTLVMDIQKLENYLKKSKPGEVAGIIPVSFAGFPVNSYEIYGLAKSYGCWVLEDSCHAPGAFYLKDGKKIYSGDCQFSDAAIFSFHPVKHIASGEGGMITLKTKELAEKVAMLRTHGITRNSDLFTNSPFLASGGESKETFPAWYMEMQTLGYNYRLTDFQAALGRSQLARAESNMSKRREIAQRYNNAFSGMSDITIVPANAFDSHAFHLYVILAERRLELYNYLRTKGIFCQIHYFPVHLMPYYKELGFKEDDFPEAESYYKRCLSLPMYPTLTEEQQGYVISEISSFYNQ